MAGSKGGRSRGDGWVRRAGPGLERRVLIIFRNCLEGRELGWNRLSGEGGGGESLGGIRGLWSTNFEVGGWNSVLSIRNCRL